MGKKNKLFSVIVPVYNAETTLTECIDSIMKQSFQDFELILVDDGSTDTSWEICEKYRKKDHRVKTIRIPNSGSFQARKMGANSAEGEYLTFSDADDWMDSEAFASAAKVISANPHIDMIAYGLQFGRDGNVWKDLYEEGIYVDYQIKDLIEEGMMFDPIIGENRLNPSCCVKFIRKRLYQDIVSDIHDYLTWGDDALVTYAVMCKAKKVGIYHESYYHYRVNADSSTHRYPLERVQQIADFQKHMIEQVKRSGYLDILEHQIESYVRMLLSLFIKGWFGLNLSAIPYVFPAKSIPVGCRLAIYGAGNVGKSYIRELKINHFASVVLWVDKRYESKPPYLGVKVDSIEELSEAEFDILLVAVASEAAAKEICEDVIKKTGISREKIVWEKPVRV